MCMGGNWNFRELSKLAKQLPLKGNGIIPLGFPLPRSHLMVKLLTDSFGSRVKQILRAFQNTNLSIESSESGQGDQKARWLYAMIQPWQGANDGIKRLFYLTTSLMPQILSEVFKKYYSIVMILFNLVQKLQSSIIY